MKEIWKDVDGFADFYQVSSKGRVRSKDRTIDYKDGRSYIYNSLILNQTQDPRGYPQVGFNACGNKSTHRVHRLVAKAFIPRKYSELPLEVNHIDGVKSNNRVDNLEWVTSSENTLKGYELGLFRKARAASKRNIKKASYHLSKKTKVTDLKTGEVKEFESLKEAAEHFGFARNTFSEALRVRDGVVKKRYKAEIIELGVV